MTTRSIAAPLLCFLAAWSAIAQIPAATESAYEEVVNVEIVNVDVYVVDDKGRPVTGLKAGDFQLFVDNDPVVLTNFLAVTNGIEQLTPMAISPPPTTQTDESQGRTFSSQATPNPLHLVIYVDNLNTQPGGRQRVVKQLKKYVQRDLQPGDRVMVVNFNRSLQMRLPFTADLQAVEAALHEVLEAPALGFQQVRLRQEAIRMASTSGCDEAEVPARNFSAQIYADVDSSIMALRSLISSLAGIEGQKALLFVSDGLQTRAGEEVFYLLSNRCPREVSRLLAIPGEYDHTATFRQLTAHANSNRVTLYPLEAIGLTAPSSSDIEVGPRRMAWTGERGTSSGGAAPPSVPLNLGGPGAQGTTLDMIMAANRQGSLVYLSQQTGGQAVLNANSVLPDLKRIDARLRNYYSLGFQPRQKEDGVVHRLRVRIDRSDVQAHYRKSFADLPWEDRMSDRLQSLVAHDGHWDNPLEATVATIDIGDSQRGLYKAKIRIGVPAANLLLDPTDDGRQTGAVQVLLTSRDLDGGRTEVARVSLPVAFSVQQLEEHPDLNFVHYLDLTLRARSDRVGLALLDEAARIASFVDHQIEEPVD